MPIVTNSLPPAEKSAPEPVPIAPVGGARTYGQILKSSVLMGGSSMLTIGVGIVRTKAMALLLGTHGFGFLGLYGSIVDLAQSVAGAGIINSGVRQIAEAVGSGDAERIARTAAVVRRSAVVLGIIGALLLVVFCRPVAKWTFGSDQYAGAVALLSVAVLFRCISAGQEALIQGTRRIADLAKMGVWAAVFGAVIFVGLIFFFREKGIVPALIGIAAAALMTSWWFRRKIPIATPVMTAGEVSQEAAALLKLGLAFMASAILTMGAAYVVRIIVRHNVSIAAAGLYQSAWALGGLYVGFILQAMGSDFYPRLTGVANNNAECNRLVNEQAEVSLLLAGPGMLATLAFAPLVIACFYSREFVGAVQPLRWICLGLALRVVAWPMGYIVLARGAQKIFFWTEVAATVVHVGLAFVAVDYFGLAGAGMAFFGLYVWHSFLIYFVVRRLTGFRWSTACWRVNLLILSALGLVFAGFYVFPLWVATTIGGVATLLCGIFSMHMLCRLVPLDRLPGIVRRLLVWFRFAPSTRNA